MSTGLSCQFVSPKDGEWYYILEQVSAPKCSWDWKEYADCYGKFDSFEKAYEHLKRYQANPGGFNTVRPENFEDGPVYRELFEKASKSIWAT